MDKYDLAVLCDARDKLCGFCEAGECEKCIVTRLIDDAFAELEEDDDGCEAEAEYEEEDENEDEEDERITTRERIEELMGMCMDRGQATTIARLEWEARHPHLHNQFSHQKVVYRHGEDDFSLWEVELPNAIMEWIKYGESMTAHSLSELLSEMPVTDELPNDTLFILVRENDEFVLYSDRVGAEFIEEYAHEGSSDRADLAYIVSCIQ